MNRASSIEEAVTCGTPMSSRAAAPLPVIGADTVPTVCGRGRHAYQYTPAAAAARETATTARVAGRITRRNMVGKQRTRTAFTIITDDSFASCTTFRSDSALDWCC